MLIWTLSKIRGINKYRTHLKIPYLSLRCIAMHYVFMKTLYVASSLSYLMAIFKLSELNENCARKKFK
jgi:hypothetical protein